MKRLLVAVVLSCSLGLSGEQIQIGIIDFYGLDRVSSTDALQAVTFKEGDTLPPAGPARQAFFAESEARLLRIPRVSRVRLEPVCCDQGRAILFVGIQEEGSSVMSVRPAPLGSARLPADVVQAGEGYAQAMISAATRGDTSEDRSEGHALNHDPAMRAIQERFIGFARRDSTLLRNVLRDSSDDKHRALAAEVLGYVGDKQAVVDDLVYAMSDPYEEVRNNAMRTLLVFAATEPAPGRTVPRIPSEPFIWFLHSLVWSDRNKGSGALVELTKDRDPALIARVRREALTPLVEMARWKSEAHALGAFLILGRLAGYSDAATMEAWARHDREAVIGAALGRR